MRRIGLIGRGHVGRATERLFSPTFEVLSWDLADKVEIPSEEMAAAETVIICIATPVDERGTLDVTGIADLLAKLPNDHIILKSTVPPGTVDRLGHEHSRDICYWPEYIGASRYHNPHFPSEIAEVPFVILGGSKVATKATLRLLQPLLGPTKAYFRCSAIEAEMIKLAENSYFATKVTFVNEIKRICDAVGADWDTVREGWLLDPRIEAMHTLVFADQPGFSGACLPKDLDGLITAAVDATYRPDLLLEVRRSNARFQHGGGGRVDELDV